LDNLEYFGIFSVPYIETIYVKIIAHDKRHAVIKFSDYLFNKGYMVNDGDFYVFPMFSDYEVI
jgi:hypothetical protein